MSVRLRLYRVGKKKKPMFRIVAVDRRKKGAFLDNLGTFDALSNNVVQFDKERFNLWVSRGAIPTDSVRKVCSAHFKKN